MRFAAVGLDHRHIYHMVGELIEAGAECAGFDPATSDPRVLDGFRQRFPDLKPRSADALIDDPTIDLVAIAAVPRHRATLAAQAMRAGKDVMVDKPGVTSFADLASVEAACRETGRIFSVCFSERFIVPATIVAEKLIADGAIGRVVQTIGMGPHRLNRAIRPAWFFDPANYGGILNDIASHHIDQFLYFTGSTDAEIVAASVGHFGSDHPSEFQDFGEVLLRSDRACGYVRVDWFTADGLPTWGDGRLTILGTEGTIELRKYVDIAGRPGTDHVFLVDREGTRHIDASREPLRYFRDLVTDVAARTESAVAQAHTFTVCRLALEAQAKAARVPAHSGKTQ
jgi:predicted dehydrogenase